MTEDAAIAGLSAHQLLAANAAVLAAATVQFITGSGFGILAAPFLLLVSAQFLPGPLLVVTLVVMLLSLMQDRIRRVDFTLGPAAALGVPGALLGVWLSTVTDAAVLGVVIGVSILSVSVSALSGRALRQTPTTLTVAGGVGGVLAGLAATPGPPVVVVYRNDDARHYRGNLSLYFLIVCVASIVVLLAGQGTIGSDQMMLGGAVLLPGVLLGVLLARPLRTRVPTGVLRPCSLALSGAAGVIVLVGAVTG